MRVVISQSMLFPWVGMLEQVRRADVFVHYDDVQFSKGSFVNRVQVKAPEGVKWLTVPLSALRLGQRIDEVQPTTDTPWREHHLVLLERSLRGAPHAADALDLARAVYQREYASLAAVARASLLALADYFELAPATRFVDVSELAIPGSASDRVLAAVQRLRGDVYVTGHGAARYLEHEKFERAGVVVEYMKYELAPYPQLHGAFTPYVSGLDLVANCGRAGARFIRSTSIPWREYLNDPAREV
jgi:hypothetical protein